MSRFFSTTLWQSLKCDWSELLRNYWLPILSSLTATSAGVVMAVSDGNVGRIAGIIFLTAALATVLFGAVALLNQDREQTRWQTIGRFILATLPLAYFAVRASLWGLSSVATGITFALFLTASIFFVLCAAELRRESTPATVWQFGLRTISAAIIAFAAALIGYIAASLAMHSISFLFDVRINSEIYASVAVIMFAGVAPMSLILSSARTRTVSRDPKSGFSPLLLRLVQIVFSPILITYFLILYAYLCKIILQGELPQESVVLPVLVYTIVGVCTFILIDPWRRTQTQALFAKLQSGILISFFPLLVIYAIAINDRVRAYGITEPRYLTILFGVWLTGVSIAYLRQRDLTLRWIPLSLAVFFFIAALPGIGAVSCAIRSQQYHLVKALKNNGILVDGKLIAHPYVANNRRVETLVETLFERQGLHSIATTLGLPNTTTDNEIKTTLLQALGAVTTWVENTQISFQSDLSQMDVRGFDQLLTVTSWPSPTFFASSSVHFSTNGMLMTIKHENQTPLVISIATFPTYEHPYYQGENEVMRVRAYVTSAWGKRREDSTGAVFGNIQFSILIQYKQPKP